MRLAVFSDIHANLEALDAFIKDASKQKIDHYICLGDIVGYGANPNACISRVCSLPGIKCVVGNHDNIAKNHEPAYDMNLTATQAILWTRKRLSEKNLQFLQTLKPVLKTSFMIFSHAAPYDPLKWQYVFNVEDAARVFFGIKQKLMFIGHTHIPQLIIKKNIFKIIFKTPDSQKAISINNKKKHIINCGSIGQPRDGDPRASYVIYDTKNETLFFRRVEYDHIKAAKKIIDAGLPESLAERLAKGR